MRAKTIRNIIDSVRKRSPGWLNTAIPVCIVLGIYVDGSEIYNTVSSYYFPPTTHTVCSPSRPDIFCSSDSCPYHADGIKERRTKINFPRHQTVKVFHPDHPERKWDQKDVTLINIGLRSMLGATSLSSARSYVAALYVSEESYKELSKKFSLAQHDNPPLSSCFKNQITHYSPFQNTILSGKLDASIVIFVNRTIYGRHIATGFERTFGKRTRDKFGTDKGKQDLKRLYNYFRLYGSIPKGTKITFTWCADSLLLEINDILVDIYHSKELAWAIFDSYIGSNNVLDNRAEREKEFALSWYAFVKEQKEAAIPTIQEEEVNEQTTTSTTTSAKPKLIQTLIEHSGKKTLLPAH